MHRRLLVLSLIAVAALLSALAPAPVARAQLVGVDPHFAPYYQSHDGVRLLGYPRTPLAEVEGFPAQYFDKGRIEDHRGAEADPAWAMMFGRLTAELIAAGPREPVSGTSLTYDQLQYVARRADRTPPPTGFRGGVQELSWGGQPYGVFIPVDPLLRPAPGYVVPMVFWAYMRRPELFPGGWLHDIGLPLSPPIQVSAYKGAIPRSVVIQAFERTVLTHDPLNPSGWEVERANIGADAVAFIELPAPQPIAAPELGANVTVPLHVMVRVGTPGQQVTARLRWADGTELTGRLPVLRGADGRGLVIGNLEWMNMLAPPRPPTQPASLELRDAGGRLLARRGVTALAEADQAARTVWVYWTLAGTETTWPQARQVVLDSGRPRPSHYWALSETERLAAATLDELLWGPPAISQVGYRTAIPTPEEVLGYPGRGADWGSRVELRSLTIRDGVATADFSPAMKAYGGGSLRVQLIAEQIVRTLGQFPGVTAVRILVDGQEGLQP